MAKSSRVIYIPIATVQQSGRSASFQLLDYHQASYNAIRREKINYVEFTVTDSEEHQPDAIAYKFYKDEGFWWLICLFNGIVEPMSELVTGTVIKIPYLSEVLTLLNAKSTKQAAVQTKGTFVSI